MAEWDPSKLTVELVPKTAWWSNVRSNVTRTEWERCKNYVKRRSGSKCEICGGVGKRYPVDCHEVWFYDDEKQIQTLVDLIALCPPCHEVKHFGRAQALGFGERALEHLCRVNGWSMERAVKYVTLQSQIWALRSRYPWELDVSFLSLLGIQAKVKDR